MLKKSKVAPSGFCSYFQPNAEAAIQFWTTELSFLKTSTFYTMLNWTNKETAKKPTQLSAIYRGQATFMSPEIKDCKQHYLLAIHTVIFTQCFSSCHWKLRINLLNISGVLWWRHFLITVHAKHQIIHTFWCQGCPVHIHTLLESAQFHRALSGVFWDPWWLLNPWPLPNPLRVTLHLWY